MTRPLFCPNCGAKLTDPYSAVHLAADESPNAAGVWDGTRRRRLGGMVKIEILVNGKPVAVMVGRPDWVDPVAVEDDWDRAIAAACRDWTDDDIPAPIEERPFARHYDCSARRFGKTLAIMADKEAHRP